MFDFFFDTLIFVMARAGPMREYVNKPAKAINSQKKQSMGETKNQQDHFVFSLKSNSFFNQIKHMNEV